MNFSKADHELPKKIILSRFDILLMVTSLPLVLLGLWFGRKNEFVYPFLLLIPFVYYLSRPALPKVNLKIFLAIFFLAIFMRFWYLSSIPYGIWEDEALLGVEVRNVLNGKSFSYRGQIVPEISALHIYWTALFSWIFGQNLWALRLPVALAGVFTVIGIYFLGRALENEITGLASTFVLAIMPWHMIFSRFNMHTIMAPLFLVWALWAVVTRRNILAGFFLGLGCYTHQSALIGFILVPLFTRSIRDLLHIYITSLVVISPLIGYNLERSDGFLGRMSRTSLWNEPNPWNSFVTSTKKHMGMLFWKGDPNPRHGIAHAPRIDWILTVLLLIGLYGKNSIKILAFYLVCLVPGILSLSFEAPQSARSINGALAVGLLAGKGMENVYRWTSPWQIGKFAIGLLGLAICFHSYSYYFLRFNNNSNTWREYSGARTQLARTVAELNHNRSILLWPGRPDIQTQYLVKNPQYERVEFVQHVHVPWEPLQHESVQKEIHFLCENWLVRLPRSFWEWYYPGCVFKQQTSPFGEDTFYQVSLYPGKFSVRTEPFPYGLHGTYIPLKPASGENIFARIDPVLRFRWHIPPFKVTEFKVEWAGFIEIPENGNYGFSLICDTSSVKKILKIDGVEIINADHQDPKGERTVELKSGIYPISIEYQSYRSPTLWFRWKTPSMNGLDTVPCEYLTHSPEQS